MPQQVSDQHPGCIFIDIDGTSLDTAIDKHPVYGWFHPECHLRELVVKYLQHAQKQGYEVYILTARPEPVELILSALDVGTLPTEQIRNFFAREGINVCRVERAGLKGEKANELFQEYQSEHPNSTSKAILLEDQLKQINSVKRQNLENLDAFDINSKKDLEKLANIINFPKEDPFHPNNIITDMKKGNRRVSELFTRIESLNANLYSREKEIITDLLNDLCIRLHGANINQYQPEIDWVENTLKHIDSLSQKLNSNRSLITHDDIEQISKKIFGTTNVDKIQPNSRCEELIKDMLLEFRKYPLIQDLIKNCDECINESKLSEKQEAIVKNIKERAEEIQETPSRDSFNNLANYFAQNQNPLKETLSGNKFAKFVHSLLLKIPVIGEMFKTANEKCADNLGKITQLYRGGMSALRGNDNDYEPHSALLCSF